MSSEEEIAVKCYLGTFVAMKLKKLSNIFLCKITSKLGIFYVDVE